MCGPGRHFKRRNEDKKKKKGEKKREKEEGRKGREERGPIVWSSKGYKVREGGRLLNHQTAN